MSPCLEMCNIKGNSCPLPLPPSLFPLDPSFPCSCSSSISGSYSSKGCWLCCRFIVTGTSLTDLEYQGLPTASCTSTRLDLAAVNFPRSCYTPFSVLLLLLLFIVCHVPFVSSQYNYHLANNLLSTYLPTDRLLLHCSTDTEQQTQTCRSRFRVATLEIPTAASHSAWPPPTVCCRSTVRQPRAQTRILPPSFPRRCGSWTAFCSSAAAMRQ